MTFIKTATGKEYETDYLASIPTPQMVFFRLPKLTFAEASVVVTNPDEMARVEYSGFYYEGLNLVALQNEAGVAKAHMTYVKAGRTEE